MFTDFTIKYFFCISEKYMEFDLNDKGDIGTRTPDFPFYQKCSYPFLYIF